MTMLPSTSAEILSHHLASAKSDITNDKNICSINSGTTSAISPSTSFMTGMKKLDTSNMPTRSKNLIVTPKALAKGDRITRYASPNRYDSLDTPHSFLDNRGANKNRNQTRLNIDRITSKATPERSLSHDQMVECSVPQSYQTSGSAVLTPKRVITTRSLPTRRPPLTTLRGSSHEGVLGSNKEGSYNVPTRRLNSLETRLQQMKDQRVQDEEISRKALFQHHPLYSDVSSANSTVFQKLFNQPHISRPLSQPEADSALWTSRQPSSSSELPDINQSFIPLNVETDIPIHSEKIKSTSPLSLSSRGHSSPLTSGQKPEITKIDSKVHTRVFIQSDATTQSKTLTYNGSTPKKFTGQSAANSKSNKSIDDNDEEDPELASKLDAIATHLGLLESKPGDGSAPSPSQIGVSNSYKVTSTTSAEFDVDKVRLSASRKMSDVTLQEDSGSVKETSSLSKRGHNSLFRSILKRFSPKTKNRSKSTSPSRQWTVKNVNKNAINSSDDAATKSSSGQNEKNSDESPGSGSHYQKSGNKIKRFFTKRLTKKEQQQASGNANSFTGGSDSCDIQPEVASCPDYLGEQITLTNSNTYSGNPLSNDESTSITERSNLKDKDEMGTRHSKHKSKQSPKSSKPDSPPDNSYKNIDPDLNNKSEIVNSCVSESGTSDPLNENVVLPPSSTPTETNDEDKTQQNLILSAFGYSSNYQTTNSEQQSKSDTMDDMLSSSIMTGSNIQQESIAEEPEDESDKEKSLSDGFPTENAQSFTLPPSVVMRRSTAPPVRCDDPSTLSPEEASATRNLMTMSFYQRQCSNKDDDLTIAKRKRNRSSSDDKRRASRSSLIILTVSKCSPRSKTISHVNSASSVPISQKINSSPFDQSSSPTSLSVSDAPLDRNALSLANTPLDSTAKLPEKDDHVCTANTPSIHQSSNNTIDKMEVSNDDVFSEYQVKPSGDGVDKATESTVNNPPSSKISENVVDDRSCARDGGKFLNVVDEIENELRSCIDQTEKDLAEFQHLMSDDVCGQLRSAAGKATLLVSDKLAQFRGLCDQNIAHQRESQRGDSGEGSFATLATDLEGFWAMVTLQIDDVRRLFDEVQQIRSNNWQMPDKPNLSNSKPKTTKATNRRTAPASRPTKKTPTPVNKEDDKARLEARKRIQAARREAMAKMKQQQEQQKSGEDSDQLCVIFA